MIEDSHANAARFAFAEATQMAECHLSFISAEPTPVEDNSGYVNLKIPISQVSGMIENLTRVLEADRQRNFTALVQATDKIDTMSKADK